MKKTITDEDVSAYKQKSEEILRKMQMVLFRAQRKVDDKAYRGTVAKLEGKK